MFQNQDFKRLKIKGKGLLCNTLSFRFWLPFQAFFAQLVEVERFPKSLLKFDLRLSVVSNEEWMNAKSRGLKLPRNAKEY